MNETAKRFPPLAPYRRTIGDDLSRLIAGTYDRGYRVGFSAGAADGRRSMIKFAGLALLVGVGLGVILAVLVGGAL